MIFKRKSSLSQCPKRSKDLISQLPDDILISIISRLSTKEAVRTSFLSRRWRNLYRYLPAYDIELHCSYLLKHRPVNNRRGISLRIQRWRIILGIVIDCLLDRPMKKKKLPHNSQLIIASLDRFLRLHSSYKIRSLRLVCCLNKSVTGCFEQCISSLGILGVEEISLDCSCSKDDPRRTSDLSFSCHLFSKMPSLKCFKLRKCSLQPSLTTCQLNNSLQTIVLASVVVCPGAVQCILSNCPSINSMTISYCNCPSKLSFCGPHLELKSLYIHRCVGILEIELYASNLLVFGFWNRIMINLIFDHVPRLQSLYLNASRRNVVPYVCGRLPLQLPHLKSLNFVTSGKGGSIPGMAIRFFINLRRLDINMHHKPKVELHVLCSILQHCLVLEEFHVVVNHDRRSCSYSTPVVNQAVALHTHLKKVEISGFGGTAYDMELALYILKSAICLEKMYIRKCIAQYELTPNGPSRWRVKYANPWSAKARRWIHIKLQGQAISWTSQVIIQHKPPPPDLQDWK